MTKGEIVVLTFSSALDDTAAGPQHQGQTDIYWKHLIRIDCALGTYSGAKVQEEGRKVLPTMNLAMNSDVESFGQVGE